MQKFIEAEDRDYDFAALILPSDELGSKVGRFF